MGAAAPAVGSQHQPELHPLFWGRRSSFGGSSVFPSYPIKCTKGAERTLGGALYLEKLFIKEHQVFSLFVLLQDFSVKSGFTGINELVHDPHVKYQPRINT